MDLPQRKGRIKFKQKAKRRVEWQKKGITITTTIITAANIYQALIMHWVLSSKPYRHYLIECSQ